MIIDQNRLLLEAGAYEPGVFVLQKCIFIDEGTNANKAGRCENLTYGGIGVAMGTPYENETWESGWKSDYDDFELQVSGIEKWGHIISLVPYFYIDYLQIKYTTVDGNHGTLDLQKRSLPMSMWLGRSIYQLFKIMREWSFMVDEPFNSDHPMALYSKMVYEKLNIPQSILEEIDGMPDMQLAKFLKGNPDYKLIPAHPQMSQEFKLWILQICEQHKDPSFEEKLNIILEQ